MSYLLPHNPKGYPWHILIVYSVWTLIWLIIDYVSIMPEIAPVLTVISHATYTQMKPIVKHAEHWWTYPEENRSRFNQEILAYFKTFFLTKMLLSDARFSHLWDRTKLSKLRPEYGFRKQAGFLSPFKRNCGARWRTRWSNRAIGVSRHNMKRMMERGILPGMYGASW